MLRLNGPLGKNKHSNKEQAGYDHLALTYLTVARFTDLYWCQLLFGVTKVLKFLKLQQQKTKFPLIILVGRKVSLEMFLSYLFFIS